MRTIELMANNGIFLKLAKQVSFITFKDKKCLTITKKLDGIVNKQEKSGPSLVQPAAVKNKNLECQYS